MLVRKYSATENSIRLNTKDKLLEADLSGMNEKQQNTTIKHFVQQRKASSDA